MSLNVDKGEKFPKMIIVYLNGLADSIQCLGCGMISHNLNDLKEIYCGNCHKFGSLIK